MPGHLSQQLFPKASLPKETLLERSFLLELRTSRVSPSSWKLPLPPRALFPSPHSSLDKPPYNLPDLVMIISVPSSWNLSQSSLVSRLQAILAISSLGMMGVVGISGSVHREEEDGLLLPATLPPNSP